MIFLKKTFYIILLIQASFLFQNNATPTHEGTGEGNHLNKTQIKLTYSLWEHESEQSTGSFSFRFSVDGENWSHYFVDIEREAEVGQDRVSYFDMGDDFPVINRCYMHYDENWALAN